MSYSKSENLIKFLSFLITMQFLVCRNKLQVCKEDAANDWEMISQKLKSELKDSAEKLIEKCNELSACKNELQKHRQEIDVS